MADSDTLATLHIDTKKKGASIEIAGHGDELLMAWVILSNTLAERLSLSPTRLFLLGLGTKDATSDFLKGSRTTMIDLSRFKR